MITIVQLEYIVAIDTYRNFVTAAEKCFVTQPTLSMQVKKAEEELGISIFDRSKQPLIPTEIGKKIIQQARIILSESKKIEEIVDEHNAILKGNLTIGIIPSLAPYILPRFITVFTRQFPDIKLTVIELLSEDIIKRLKEDTIDVGLLVTPLNEKYIKEEPLFYEKILIYSNRNYPLAHRENITTKDLTNNNLWLLGKGHCFRNQVVNICSYQEQEESPFYYESGSLETIKKIVASEEGYTLLPELAIAKNCEPPSVVIKPFHNETPVREVSLVYSRIQHKKRMIEKLNQTIKDIIPQKMQNADRGQIVEWR